MTIEQKYSNPNKQLDWTITSQHCAALHMKYREDACRHCPAMKLHLETITPENCKMYDDVVLPLLEANTPIRKKDLDNFTHYLKTGVPLYQ